ncbi:MAG TPA: lipid-binding SYLF domain-containing protein [Bryobacteraceae bacterium]|nr:lipid-binding SYLF domain-containing protein [Bryobacteraceae bacterium]
MKKLLILASILGCSACGLFADTAAERLEESGRILHEIMETPDQGIPQNLMNKAYCVAIVPSLKKGAFVVGGEYGKGFVICRKGEGMGWGAPAAIKVEGGSFGFQIGGSATDVVMLIMNKHGMRELDKDKFTLGGDASIAAGPVGRTATANTDAYMSAEILSWSRTKGLFAGVALSGATLRPDRDSNRELYGEKLDSRQVLMTRREPPAAAKNLISELDKYSMRKEG